MWQSLQFELSDKDDGSIGTFDEWPIAYKIHHVDPWDQLNALDHEIQQEHEHARKNSGEEKAHFEAGSWTLGVKRPTHGSNSCFVPVEWLTRRLADTVGLPINAGPHSFLETRLARAQDTIADANEALLWRTVSYIRSTDDDLMNRSFGRIQVAAMPTTLVDNLVNALCGAIDYSTTGLRDRDENYGSKVEQVRLLTEILSRLAVRCNPDVAAELIKLATTIVERANMEHWWLFKSIGNLLTRSLSAIPASERGKHVAQMLVFPLPGERKIKGIERDWPEFSDEFRHNAVSIERPTETWDRRINELIDWVSRDDRDNRHRAILRLWLLYLKQALTEDEVLKFADAIWRKRYSPQSLPMDDGFYPAVFLQLPDPAPGIAVEAFTNDVLKPLLRGEVTPSALESIAYIGSEADKGRAQRPFSPAIALELIRKIPFPSTKDVDEQVSEAIFFGLLPIAPLDEETISRLWSWAKSDSSVNALRFLPYIAKHDSTYEAEAIILLQRAINSREFKSVDSAFSAIRLWSQIIPNGKFPSSLASATASLVAMRRDPGLFRAIDVSVDLIREKLMSEEDISVPNTIMWPDRPAYSVFHHWSHFGFTINC